jgi:hypothetical protein
MHYKDRQRLIDGEVARILKDVPWDLYPCTPPPAFEFRARPIDVEILMAQALLGDDKSPECCTQIELCHNCSSRVSYHSGAYSFYSSKVEPPYLWCHSTAYCSGQWPIADVAKMSEYKLADIFSTRETLLGDTLDKWPMSLQDVDDKDARYLAERQMSKEELVRRRVERFYTARQDFRKEFPNGFQYVD